MFHLIAAANHLFSIFYMLFKVAEPAELMTFLRQKLPQKSRNNIKTLLHDQQVWVDNAPVTQFNYLLKPQQQVEIKREKTATVQPPRGLPILFEDSHLIVINKPAGLLSMATDREKQQTAYGQLSNYVKQQNPQNKIFIVHRLDRDTSGIMVFAKSENAKNLLQEFWNTDTKERIYVALTEGCPKASAGTITSYLHESKALIVYSSQNPQHGQKAITHYETLKTNQHHALLRVRLQTGRKNQVRVHLQDLGSPIIGDKKYGATTNPIGRLGLHALVLGFLHPMTNEALRFETPIPTSFLTLF